MDINGFWTVVEAVRAGSSGQDGKEFVEAPVDQLERLSQEEILGCQERFDEAHDAVYRWDVWGRRPSRRGRLLGRPFHGLPGRPDRSRPGVVRAGSRHRGPLGWST